MTWIKTIPFDEKCDLLSSLGRFAPVGTTSIPCHERDRPLENLVATGSYPGDRR